MLALGRAFRLLPRRGGGLSTLGKSKGKKGFACSECGAQSTRWQGQCGACQAWNTMAETSGAAASGAARRSSWVGAGQLTDLSDVSTERQGQRIHLSCPELEHVLGGGVVPGSLVLVAGSPGIGKSTLMMQLAGMLRDATERRVVYVSGEESGEQLRMRADRLAIAPLDISLLCETHVESVVEAVQGAPKGQQGLGAVVVDSIQTMFSDRHPSSPGTVTQVRESAVALLQAAKALNVPIFLTGHVTKSGEAAGPRVLEHIVDVVAYIEGDAYHEHRLLRCAKNRFGSTNEVGIFTMTETGLQGADDPDALFLRGDEAAAPGSVTAMTVEGTRPMGVEIQALTTKVPPQLSFSPKHHGLGFDHKRLAMLLAVLTRQKGLGFSSYSNEVFVNVAGGLSLREPAMDLPVALALASSVRGVPVTASLACAGEVGLTGDVRSVPHLEKRVAAAARLGFESFVVPRVTGGDSRRRAVQQAAGSLNLIEARTVGEAIARVVPRSASSSSSSSSTGEE